MDHMFPRKDSAPRAALGYGDYDTVLDVLSEAVRRGPYLMGEQFTAADVVIGSGLRFGMMFKGIPERPEFVAYAGRMTERPAAKRATQKDQELMAAAG
jgi:glutathione S-transferase